VTAGDVHTVYYLGLGWLNVVLGTGAVGRPCRHKHDAVKRGEQIARENRSEHLIHDLEGRPEERISYRPLEWAAPAFAEPADA